jgi:pimeloyl-ACP methyl ester carboxylesterase
MKLPDHMVCGDGDTTVYLLHGAYGSKEYWRYTAQTLCRAGYRVVAWDAPGYGISPVPANMTIPGLAHSFNSLVAHTRTRRTVVLGHSMGGMVAQKAYDLAPDTMDALVLSATAHTFNHSGPQWQADFLRTRVAPLTSGRTIREYAPEMLRTMMGPGASGPIIEHILYNVQLMDGEGFQAAVKALTQYLEEDVIARVKIPCLCIAGELDTTCPSTVMRKMAALANGEFHEMKGVGHYGWGERPSEYHDKLIDFMQRRLPA